MLNQYPSWKYVLLLVVLVFGSIYALPNIYGADPAIQISATRNNIVDSEVESKALAVLKSANINLRRSVLDDKGLLKIRNKTVRLKILNRQKSFEERTFYQILNVLLPLLLLLIFGIIFHLIRRRKYN